MRTRAPAVVSLLAVASLGLTSCADLGGLDLSAVGDEGKTTYIKLALNQAETHPSYIALENLSNRFEEETDGRWKIEVFPNEQLGSQQEVLQFVKSGAIEMAIVSGTQLENMNKDFQVLNMPTTFGSIEHQMNVVRDQDLMAPLFESLSESDNITVIGGFTQGTRNLYATDTKVVTPEDLAGKKIRVQESTMHIRMIELMGGSATPLSYGEVYTAMQSGVLDGAENNEVSYVTQNHNEVAPFHSNTEHLVGLDYMVMRHDLLEAMDDADRELFLEQWDEAMTEHTDLWNSETDAAIERAKAAGAEFIQVDRAAFDAALAPIKDEFLTNDFQRDLYDAVRAADDEEAAS